MRARLIVVLLAGVFWGTCAHASTVVRELHYGEVLFLYYQQQHFDAMVHLEAGRATGTIRLHEAEAELLLGGMLLSWRQWREAAAIFSRLLDAHDDPSVRDRARFQLARIAWQRGDAGQAAKSLAALGTHLPTARAAEAELLRARVAIATHDYPTASRVLADFDGPDDWRAYARYNLGVALLDNGSADEGLAQLDTVGRLRSADGELAALADRANVTLGFAQLRDGRPAPALVALERVRLDGPFANAALLGAGWAHSEQSRHRDALTPWLTLRGRDLLDPAVQESLLAVPYAFASLGAHAQAAEYYATALEVLDDEIARLEHTIERVRAGSLVPALLAAEADADGLRAPAAVDSGHWRLAALPDRIETRYLHRLLAGHAFQEGLRNYRDLRFLATNLSRRADDLAAFDDMIDARMLAWQAREPRARRMLDGSDAAALSGRHRALAARVERIAEARDTHALASTDEHALLAALAESEARLVRVTPVLTDDAHDELATRQRVLAGVLDWRLHADFEQRLWDARRDLRDTGDVLSEIDARLERIDALRAGAPERFDALGARVAAYTPRVAALAAAVELASVRQRDQLDAMAVTALEREVARMRAHELQARFALARIHDRAASVTTPDTAEGARR